MPPTTDPMRGRDRHIDLSQCKEGSGHHKHGADDLETAMHDAFAIWREVVRPGVVLVQRQNSFHEEQLVLEAEWTFPNNFITEASLSLKEISFSKPSSEGG